MPEARKCSKCGAELQADAPGGHCLKCLLQLGLEAEPPPASKSTIRLEFEAEKPGQRIGRYKLLQQLGEGGCGVVYMADQEEPVKRRVALKVIKPGMDTKEVLGRFEAERQALALMDHSNIAKVFDAGATENGRPFFVMELVRGMPITRYCDENKLSTKQRLELFMLVCQAIQHAHQKGIIHRDIKPSNILVADHDGVPVPKIIDFGIAKATTGQTLTNKTVFTALEQFIGTPAYMSPEQAKLSGLDIDTRSDIYSLGVLLYELLTGKTPFDGKKLLAAGLDEIRRVIRDEEPPRPSQKLSTLAAAEQTAAARHRQTDSPRLINLVRGDLDWIVMKCLEKDRNRRYETANGLAREVERYLKNEPILARPPSSAYRFKKIVRRNKLAFAAASAVALSLIIGLGVSLVLLAKEREATRRETAAELNQVQLRRQAQAEAESSREVARFLQDMLQGVGPSVAQGRDTTMLREILDKTTGRIGKELTNEPAVEAELLSAVGSVYEDLGQHSKAESLHRQALVLWRSRVEGQHAEMIDSLHGLAAALASQGKWDEAEATFNEALALRGLRPDSEPGQLLGLAIVLMNKGDLDQAEGAVRRAMDLQRKLSGEDNPATIGMLRCLAGIDQKRGKLADAEALMREQLTITRRLGDNVEIAWSIGILAGVLMDEGKWSETETLAREELAIQIKLYPEGHPTLADSLALLGGVLTRERKFKELEVVLRDLLSLQKKLYGDDDPKIADTLGWLGTTLQNEGKLAESDSTVRDALARRSKLYGENSTNLLGTLNTLSGTQYREGKTKDYEISLRQILAIKRKLEVNDDPDVMNTILELSWSLQLEGKTDESETLLREVQTGIAKLRPEDLLRVDAGIISAMKTIEDKQHHPSRDLCDQALKLNTTNGGWFNSAAWALLTSVKAANRDPALAVELAKRAVDLSPNDGNIWNTLGFARYRAGDWHQAVDDLGKAVQCSKDGGSAYDFLFLAMAHHRLGEPEAAASNYTKAVDLEVTQNLRSGQLLDFRVEARELLGNEAERGDQEELEIWRKKRDSDPGLFVNVFASHADLKMSLKQYADAEAAYREALQARLAIKGEAPYPVWLLEHNLGVALAYQHKFPEAEQILRQCVEAEQQTQADEYNEANTKSWLGQVLTGEGRLDEAEPILLAAYGTLKTAPEMWKPNQQRALERIVNFYLAAGKPEKAKEWGAMLSAPKPATAAADPE